MGREVELLQNWLEQIAYQMTTMSHAEAQLKISDIMCNCKAYASVVYEKVARETTMVLGGNALRAGGVGEIVEGAVAQVKGRLMELCCSFCLNFESFLKMFFSSSFFVFLKKTNTRLSNSSRCRECYGRFRWSHSV